MFNLKIKSEEQLGIIIAALDLYTRLGIGQLEESIIFSCDAANETKWHEITNSVEFRIIKHNIWGFSHNGSYGICNPKVLQTYREAYTMEKILQKLSIDYRKATGKLTSSWSTWADGNILKLNELPEIETSFETNL